MANLSLLTHENQVYILIIQEPYQYMGEPRYIPPDFQTIYAHSNRNPRASLLIRRDMIHNIIFFHQYSDPYNTIVVTDPPLYIASSYLPLYDTLEQDLTSIKIAKAYRTTSNEALCTLTGLTPIVIQAEKEAKIFNSEGKLEK